MARCPRCTRSFRTLEDEQGMHDCPHCGCGPGDVCFWCEDLYHHSTYTPYCSSLCAARAQADSMEDDSCA